MGRGWSLKLGGAKSQERRGLLLLEASDELWDPGRRGGVSVLTNSHISVAGLNLPQGHGKESVKEVKS
jgi:hypothetical protein